MSELSNSAKALRTVMDFLSEIKSMYPRIAITAVLGEVYNWAMKAKPALIVELGVSREALANRVLSAVAEQFESEFISCDLQDYKASSSYENWQFVCSDDIKFGKEFFKYSSRAIDLLFIDTDELYPHSKQEIETFFPLLNIRCMVMFRCTNLKKRLIYKDGISTDLGWDNNRGVIRAIEEYFNFKMDETIEFTKTTGEWMIHHYPWGAGFTVLKRGYDRT